MTAPHLSADDIIRLLRLAPHPEGGHYRETFRDTRTLEGGRAASTAIYFLLRAGEISRWHRVDAVEIWHWHAGAPLELGLAADVTTLPQTIRLGPGLGTGEVPQAVVPAHHWQQARALGPWTLVGCTVAPGFSFEGFEMAPDGFRPGR